MSTLILSCITTGEDQTTRVLNDLARAGIAKQAIVVLHPGDALPGQALPQPTTPSDPPSVIGTAASVGAAGGMFGWLLGFGVLALPGALLIGTVGALTGVAVGITQKTLHHLSDEVQHHYAHRIVDNHLAILVKVDDFTQYQQVLEVFLAADGRHILTSRNNRALAETQQLDAIAHHPEMIADAAERSRAASTVR